MFSSASMRPGPDRPGNVVAAVTPVDPIIIGFNEARAGSPGKYRHDHGGVGRHARFNEARAGSPGK